MTTQELETENWQLRGDLTRYEASLAKAREAIAAMKHILTCHKEEVIWGTLDADGTLKDRPIDQMTRYRVETVDEALDLAEEFEKSAPL